MVCDNRCLADWATVVYQEEKLSTHWISLYLSYSQCVGEEDLGGCYVARGRAVFIAHSSKPQRSASVVAWKSMRCRSAFFFSLLRARTHQIGARTSTETERLSIGGLGMQPRVG